MFTKALVGVELSPAADALLSCLPDLSAWGVHTLVLAHVIPVGYVQGAGYGHEAELRRWLEGSAAPLRETGLSVTTSLSARGAPAGELLAQARHHGADLVVVGSRSHNFLHDIFLGSVAHEVICNAAIPVLIERLEPARPGRPETCAAVCRRALDRVLLASDLSGQCAAAEDAAVALAGRAGRIDCLTVLAPGAGEDVRQAARCRHASLVLRVKDAGGAAGSRIEQGDPAEVIAQTARQGYSLVILGKHGENWIEGKIMGSTAEKVCKIAQRPVLMVPVA